MRRALYTYYCLNLTTGHVILNVHDALTAWWTHLLVTRPWGLSKSHRNEIKPGSKVSLLPIYLCGIRRHVRDRIHGNEHRACANDSCFRSNAKCCLWGKWNLYRVRFIQCQHSEQAGSTLVHKEPALGQHAGLVSLHSIFVTSVKIIRLLLQGS